MRYKAKDWKKETNRNRITQIIHLKDGTIKLIHHEKPTPKGDYKSLWKKLNEMPKY